MLSNREGQTPRKKKQVVPQTVPQVQPEIGTEEDRRLQQLFAPGVPLSIDDILHVIQTTPKEQISQLLQERIDRVPHILAKLFFSQEGIYKKDYLGIINRGTGTLSFFFLEDYGVSYDSVIPAFISSYKKKADVMPMLLAYLIKIYESDTTHSKFIPTIFASLDKDSFEQYITFFGTDKKQVLESTILLLHTLGVLHGLIPQILKMSNLSISELIRLLDFIIGEIKNNETVKSFITLSGHKIGILYGHATPAIAEFIRQNYSSKEWRPMVERTREGPVELFLDEAKETKWNSFIQHIPASDIDSTRNAVEIFQDSFRVEPLSKQGKALQELLKTKPAIDTFLDLISKLLFEKQGQKRLSVRHINAIGEEEWLAETFEHLPMKELPIEQTKVINFPNEEIKNMRNKLVTKGYILSSELIGLLTKYNGIFEGVVSQINSRSKWTPLTLQELYSWGQNQRNTVSVDPTTLINNVFSGIGVSPFIKKILASRPGWGNKDLTALVESLGLSLPVHEIGTNYRYFVHTVDFISGQPFDHPKYGNWGRKVDRREEAQKNMFTMVAPFMEGFPYPEEFKTLELPDPHLKSDVVGWVMVEPHNLKTPGGGVQNIWLVQELQSDMMKKASDNFHSGNIDAINSIVKYILGQGEFPKEISALGGQLVNVTDTISRKQVFQQVSQEMGARLERSLKRKPSPIEIKERLDSVPEQELDAYMLRIKKQLARNLVYKPFQEGADNLKAKLYQKKSIEPIEIQKLFGTFAFPNLKDILQEFSTYRQEDLSNLVLMLDKERIESEKWGTLFKYIKDFPRLAYKYLITVAKSLEEVDELWIPTADVISRIWKQMKVPPQSYVKYYDEPAKEFGGIATKIPSNYKDIKGNYLLGAQNIPVDEAFRLNVKQIPYKLLAKKRL